jgi:FixJ family two-component response regulator
MPSRNTIVAVVEDDVSMQKSIERLLTAHGFGTELYASAEEFLAREQVIEFTCVLIDVHLPGMSGIELRRRLAASGSKLPVIFMTAVDDADSERDALASGCLAYLHKPIPPALLINAINRAPE